MLPTKTLAYAQEKTAPGFKKSKDRVTVLLCCNSSGSLKLKPLVIGKSKKPRAFKNLDIACLPTLYMNQTRGWMEQRVFSEWFFNSFVPVVEAYLKKINLPRKALLLMDNAPSHPDIDEVASGDIKCMFLPPNVTSLIQPLDQGVIETFKRNYRKRLLQVLLGKLEGGNTVTETLKNISVKDAVFWSAMGWDEVQNQTLQKSWRKLFGIDKPKKDDPAQQDLNELTELANQMPVINEINNEDIQEWVKDDDQNQLSDNEIVNIVISEQGVEEEEDDTNETVPKVSHAEGLKRIEAALEYIEQQEESTAAETMMLQRWRYTSAKKRNKSMTQKSIKDFFGK